MSLEIIEGRTGIIEVVPTSDPAIRAVATSLVLATAEIAENPRELMPERSGLGLFLFMRKARKLADVGNQAYLDHARSNAKKPYGIGEDEVAREKESRSYTPGFKIDCAVGLELLPIGAPFAKAKEVIEIEALASDDWAGNASYNLSHRARYNEVYFPVLDQLAELELPRSN